jgi:hypothetical protein
MVKVIAVIAILVVAFTVAFPVSIYCFPSGHDEGARLATLDICHEATPSLAGGGMPCMPSNLLNPLPPALQEIVHIVNPGFQPLLIAVHIERPPLS